MPWQQAYAIRVSIDRKRERKIDRYLLNQNPIKAELIHDVITVNQFSFLR